MCCVVAAWWRARAGSETEVERLLLKLTEHSRAEPACLVYQAHRSDTDPAQFFLYEVYKDADAYQKHLDSQHFNEFAKRQAFPLLERRDREFYATVHEAARDTA